MKNDWLIKQGLRFILIWLPNFNPYGNSNRTNFYNTIFENVFNATILAKKYNVIVECSDNTINIFLVSGISQDYLVLLYRLK